MEITRIKTWRFIGTVAIAIRCHHTWLAGKIWEIPEHNGVLKGTSAINGGFSIAMFDHQRAHLRYIYIHGNRIGKNL